MTEQQRKFEAWYCERYTTYIPKTEDGRYCNLDTALAWNAWQAASPSGAVELTAGQIEAAADKLFGGYSDEGYGNVTLPNLVNFVASLAMFAVCEPAQPGERAAIPLAWQDNFDGLLAYVLQDELHNRLTPRVIDIAYTAFMSGACGKNEEDGGRCDWFNDTKPAVEAAIEKIREELAEARARRIAGERAALLRVLELADTLERHRTNQAWLNLREAVDVARAASPQSDDSEPLTCDFCGAVTDDPWHTSDATRKHLHQCDACHATAFDPTAECNPFVTSCPRCKNPHNACDREVFVAGDGSPADQEARDLRIGPYEPKAEAVESLCAEVARLNSIINTPQSGDFLRAVSIEAEHQRQRWGSSHDAGKAPSDWFWLIGYLAGKALHAHAAGDIGKAEHHVITIAAALANWHGQMFGTNDMRPGIETLVGDKP